MLICPKLGVDNISIDENLVPYLNGTFEIQMSGDNLHNSFLKSIRIIEAVKKFITVNEVILHLPFKFHTFELFKMFPGKLAELNQMLDMSSEFAGKQNIKLGILFHSELGFDYIQNDEMISFIYRKVKNRFLRLIFDFYFIITRIRNIGNLKFLTRSV